jgi:hypothetical protein
MKTKKVRERERKKLNNNNDVIKCNNKACFFVLLHSI